MNTIPLQTGEAAVQTGLIDATGWIIGLGGIALTVLWLRHLYR